MQVESATVPTFIGGHGGMPFIVSDAALRSVSPQSRRERRDFLILFSVISATPRWRFLCSSLINPTALHAGSGAHQDLFEQRR